MRIGDGLEVRVVRVAVLATPGVDGDAVLRDERGSNVILRRQRVAGGEDDLRPAGLERPHQVGGLGRDVETGTDAEAVERPVALEALADETEDRHLSLGPLDAPDALGGQP
jgi:hypothetical protein